MEQGHGAGAIDQHEVLGQPHRALTTIGGLDLGSGVVPMCRHANARLNVEQDHAQDRCKTYRANRAQRPV